MSSINEKLRLGQLPDELNFTASFVPDFDVEKVRYNTYYKSPEFWLHKFENPVAFLNLPGGEKILESLIEKAQTPLEEIISRSIEYGEKSVDGELYNERQCEKSD